MIYYVYTIYNSQVDKFYIGHTDNLKKRMLRHNDVLPNKKTSYTSKNKGIWELIYQEEYETRTEAMKREKYLKSYRGRQFIKNIIIKRKNMGV